MKNDFLADWIGYISFRLLGPFFRALPLRLSFFLGGRLGVLLYYFDAKHRALAYANLKTAFGGEKNPRQIKRLTKDFYRSFGRNFIEIFLIPLISPAYINKYIDIQGGQYINDALKRGKGVILLGIHEGSWELSNVACANLGFPLTFFIRRQKFPRLNRLLNSYRAQKGCRLIESRNQTRDLVRALKNNNVVGMTADQGGRRGALTDFFGKDASWASGAVRLALKHDCVILPGFYRRVKGPYMKIILEPALELEKSVNSKDDIMRNVKKIAAIFEGYLKKYSQEYIWFYKIWKYSLSRKILILSDGKAGHLGQSQAAAKILASLLKEKNITADTEVIEVRFKNSFCAAALSFSCLFASRRSCQGCMRCFEMFLSADSRRQLLGKKYDFIISAGSRVAAVNYILSGENMAKSIAVMRSRLISAGRFDLAVIPEHDRPKKRKNTVVTQGALNLIDTDYLRDQARQLQSQAKITKSLILGLLIGGDSKNFSLSPAALREVAGQLKKFSEDNDAEILVSTSRRSRKETERIIKEEFAGYARCKFLVIANEANFSFAVGGILGLSKIVVISAESISMLSEAASSVRYVVAFGAEGVAGKHKRFLNRLQKNGNIYLCREDGIYRKLEWLLAGQPKVKSLEDSFLLSQALRKIL